MQVLEGGTKETVMTVYGRIQKDIRNHRMTKLLDGEIDKPQFSNWSIGFKHLDKDTCETMGFSEFMLTDDNNLTDVQKVSLAWKLLASFRRNNT